LRVKVSLTNSKASLIIWLESPLDGSGKSSVPEENPIRNKSMNDS